MLYLLKTANYLILFGGADGDRTHDLMTASHVVSHKRQCGSNIVSSPRTCDTKAISLLN